MRKQQKRTTIQRNISRAPTAAVKKVRRDITLSSKHKFMFKRIKPEDLKTSIILRYSNRSKHRLRNLRILLKVIQTVPFAEIIISVMEDDIPDGDIQLNERTIKHFTPDPFESSKANNIGASLANSDIFIFQDADILFNTANYRKIVDHLSKGNFESARVGQSCANLGEFYVSQIAGNNEEAENKLQALLQQTSSGAMRDAPGGVSAITRKAFIKVGGFCELFKKYGWEDCYYKYKVGTLVSKVDLKGDLFHLWHEENYQSGHQAVNAQLYNDILAGNAENFAKRDRDALLDAYKVFK